MWILLNNAFFSIVHKDCGPDELLVRARRPKDIQRLWPDAEVTKNKGTDYAYRAVIPKADVSRVLVDTICAIDYGNFKNTVKERDLHDAYFNVWSDLYALQKGGPHG